MSGLERAVRRRRWDLVWLYLAVAVAEAASQWPHASLDELLEMLAWDQPEEGGGGADAARDGA